MAGTFNSKNGWLTLTGLYVDNIVVRNKFSVDSDWVTGLIMPAIEAMNLDSEVVSKIAKAVDLNDLIDSDAIYTIANQAIKDSSTDSDAMSLIADAAAAIVQGRLDLVSSELDITKVFVANHDSDVAALAGKYATILSNDAVQTATIATNTADILTISTRVTENDSEIAEIEADVTAIYGRTTAAETATEVVEARATALEAVVGNVGGGGHEARLVALEAAVAALQAQIVTLTLNDLTDVDTTGLAVGDVLEWNGTDFVPVATS
jgi:hypothetical protein